MANTANHQHPATARILMRRPQVEAATGLAKSSIYRMVKEGQFPQPIKLSARSVAWPSDAVEGWIASRCAA